MISDVDIHSVREMERCLSKGCHNMARNGFGPLAELADKKEDVMRLVEAMISGCVDLSPEEMVDAAFILVNKINERINNE